MTRAGTALAVVAALGMAATDAGGAPTLSVSRLFGGTGTDEGHAIAVDLSLVTNRYPSYAALRSSRV